MEVLLQNRETTCNRSRDATVRAGETPYRSFLEERSHSVLHPHGRLRCRRKVTPTVRLAWKHELVVCEYVKYSTVSRCIFMQSHFILSHYGGIRGTNFYCIGLWNYTIDSTIKYLVAMHQTM